MSESGKVDPGTHRSAPDADSESDGERKTKRRRRRRKAKKHARPTENGATRTAQGATNTTLADDDRTAVASRPRPAHATGPHDGRSHVHDHHVENITARPVGPAPAGTSQDDVSSMSARLRPDDGNAPRRRKRRRRPNRAERRAQALAATGGSGAEQAGTAADGRVSAGTPHVTSPDAMRMSQTGSAGSPSRTEAIQCQRRSVTDADGRKPDPPDRPAQEMQRTRAGDAQRRPPDPGVQHASLYGALDLGTNNCRLLVAKPDARGFRVVDAYSKIVRLGEGLGHGNRLGESAMQRAIEALACCRDKMRGRGVARARLIATEACRTAENGPQFLERVRAETGLSLEIATRETEARLAVAGCASLVDPRANGVVLFDIGGGSSEIVWLDLRNRCGARGVALTRFIRAWISLPVGVVNLAERHGGRHVSADVFEAMVQDARQHLEAFALGRELTEAICDGDVHMLGTSGTVTTLAGVHFGLKRYDRRRVDGAWMESEDVSAMIDRLRAMSYEERVVNPCIGADRADLVLAGCAILEAIRRRWPCNRLRVADRGLREGILMELMTADNVWRRRRAARAGARGRNGK